MIDLFLTKESCLLEWCRKRRVFNKADVIRWGLENYYIRAERTIREFVEEGNIRRLGPRECEIRNLTGKIAWYEYVIERDTE